MEVPAGVQRHRLAEVLDGRVVVASEFVDPPEIGGQKRPLHSEVVGFHRIDGGVVGQKRRAAVPGPERKANPPARNLEVGQGGRQLRLQGIEKEGRASRSRPASRYRSMSENRSWAISTGANIRDASSSHAFVVTMASSICPRNL